MAKGQSAFAKACSYAEAPAQAHGGCRKNKVGKNFCLSFPFRL